MAKQDDWMAQYEARERRQQAHSERLAEYLVPALRFLGVETVQIEFDGYGDEGDVHDATFGGPRREDVPEALAEMLEAACCYALPGGWEVNAGSYGVWCLDVEAGKARLDMEYRDEDDFAEGDED
jgi:hypothetical protein